jgi:CheY-like chemotaxis protein
MSGLKKKILLVDDDIDCLIQQKSIIESEGYHVITTETEGQALEAIGNRKFDLAVIDLMLDDMDSGSFITYKIKDKNPKTPVIMVTSLKNKPGFDMELSQKYGQNNSKPDLILAKPINAEQFLDEIKKMLV